MIALAGVAVVAAAFTGVEAEGATLPELAWRDCGDGVQCATVTVPIDWTRPHGPTTEINLGKLPAREPQHRKGALIANLGAGNSTAALHAPEVAPGLAALAKDFDLVVFDPRGIGSPANGTLTLCAQHAPPVDALVLARTEADWQADADRNARYDASCRTAMGQAYWGLNSWQIAHDVDALRAALGEQKLRYFGNSYGTTYGQAYAELFPEKVGQMYVEGVPDHTDQELSPWLIDHAVTQERDAGAVRRLVRAAAWMPVAWQRCPGGLGRTGGTGGRGAAAGSGRRAGQDRGPQPARRWCDHRHDPAALATARRGDGQGAGRRRWGLPHPAVGAYRPAGNAWLRAERVDLP